MHTHIKDIRLNVSMFIDHVRKAILETDNNNCLWGRVIGCLEDKGGKLSFHSTLLCFLNFVSNACISCSKMLVKVFTPTI